MGIFFSDLVFYRTIILYERDKGHITIKMAVNVPKKQMAQVIEKTGGPVQFKEIDVQQPGPDEVLINIKYSGVCHTDLHAVNGDWPLPTKLPQRYSSGCSGACTVCWYYRLQGPEGEWCKARTDCCHCWRRRWSRLAGAAVRQGHGPPNHRHR